MAPPVVTAEFARAFSEESLLEDPLRGEMWSAFAREDAERRREEEAEAQARARDAFVAELQSERARADELASYAAGVEMEAALLKQRVTELEAEVGRAATVAAAVVALEDELAREKKRFDVFADYQSARAAYVDGKRTRESLARFAESAKRARAAVTELAPGVRTWDPVDLLLKPVELQ